MPRQVAIRLGTEGRAQVVADLDAIGAAGDANARRVANSFIRASRDADQALEFANRQAKKLEALLPGLNPTKLDMAAGVRDNVGKSAESSAAVFSAAYAQMEARANALRAAIDPAWAAQQRFDREIAEARMLMAAGVLTLDEYSKAAWRAQQGLDAAGAGQVRATQTVGGMGRAFASAAPQVQDLFVQISMGANPINAMVVQSGQLAGQLVYLEGRAGAVARFLMGPWGLAFQVGLLAMAPLVAKLWEGSEADKEAAKAKEEHRKAVLALADAQQKAILTAERKQALDVAQIKIDLDAALATRQRTAAALAEARENLEAAQRRVNEGGGDEAAMAASNYQSDVSRLDAAMRDNTKAIGELQKGFDAGLGRMVQRNAEAASTPEGRIGQRYAAEIAKAITDLPGEANAGRLRAKLDELIAARERELKSIEKSTQARDQDTLTAAQVKKMLMGALPGVQVTSTTGGKHVAGSYHYKNRAIDFVPAGGMGSMTKDDVRRIFESRGIDVIELLGPGDKGHSDHFHVAWAKGKNALDEFTDAAKRAEERKQGLDALMKAFDPAAAAAEEYRQTLAKIDALKPADADSYRWAAQTRYVRAVLPNATVDAGLADFGPASDRRKAARDYGADLLADQRDRLALGQRGQSGVISSVAYLGCTLGYRSRAGGGGNEFDVHVGVTASDCATVFDLAAGNHLLVGVASADSKRHVRLRSGSNHAHGVIGVSTFAHITSGGDYLLWSTDVTNGETIVGTHWYGSGYDLGSLFIQRSTVNMAVGIIDAVTHVEAMSAPNSLTNFPYSRQSDFFLPGAYGSADVVSQPTSDPRGRSQMIRRNCFGPGLLGSDGYTTNDPADLYVCVEQHSAGAAFANGDILKFPFESPIGDRRLAHDPATGLVTIPKWMDGHYEIWANFMITGTGLDPAGSYFDVVCKVGGTGSFVVIGLLVLPQVFDPTKWAVRTGIVTRHCLFGDQIGIRATNVNGTTKLLGSADWVSQFVVKKIA